MKGKPEKPAKALMEGRDYYIEEGRFVFTEYYLKGRGFCCRNGCRHCPYGFPKKKATDAAASSEKA